MVRWPCLLPGAIFPESMGRNVFGVFYPSGRIGRSVDVGDEI